MNPSLVATHFPQESLDLELLEAEEPHVVQLLPQLKMRPSTTQILVVLTTLASTNHLLSYTKHSNQAVVPPLQAVECREDISLKVLLVVEEYQ